jgi:hypothetical protein
MMVAFHTADWLPIAVESYLEQFPHDRLLVVDNNPRPGETGWSVECRRESRWLIEHPRIDVIRRSGAYPGAPVTQSHGAGIDLALEWCRSRGADVMVHFEPDCLVTGRAWRDNLLAAIEAGGWMAGAVRKDWGPIHPTPSAWLVREARTTFQEQPREQDMRHPRYAELIDMDRLKIQADKAGVWDWARDTWDAGDRAWFEAAVLDKAVLVDAPGFHHFWYGTTAHALPLDQLLAKFPELATWLGRPGKDERPRRVEDCIFRRDVRYDAQAKAEFALCGLIHKLSGVRDPRMCEVRRDVCQACRECSDPSVSSINPPVASRLFRLAAGIVARGGVEGCDATSAVHLRDFAERHLDLRLPGEVGAPTPRRRDRACEHLGAELGSRVILTASGPGRERVHACRHPDHAETTIAECRFCRDWTDQPLHDRVPIETLLPPPLKRVGRHVRSWAVGVTTAPRPRPTLSACLESLFRAGWQVPRLFVDSAVTIPDRFSELPVTLRETKLGPWPNYYLSLVELLMREPEADAFMLVQDDVILDDRYDLRGYLEKYLWPADPIGAVSLYCSKVYTQPQAGWHEFAGPWVWGALTFVFSRESAKRFVTDPSVFEHRGHPDDGLIKVDVEIGRWAHAQGLPIYFPTPSLVQHIGDTSSLWTYLGSRAMGDRRADQFSGDVRSETTDPT